MSKCFYKGTPDIMGHYGKSGYNTKAKVKPGSDISPLSLTVNSQAREQEVAALVAQHGLVATIVVDGDAEENIAELTAMLATPKTVQVEKTPERNAPCSCGSGKKYKKCCG
ncbi:SWIM/SEC-C metal-binding motif-containing protein, PBPRA1643 family [Amphritea atlantica]|uniref:SWIM/SEC-C metal-binding motif-containing protein, PBPRA1643 family n=1 Tax=Amphritea atlantica TaxID=355243 RepID=A0A1H9JST9_9GAMM|nr:PBPRA1643 family SWIM/SEC-C metal-binding motif protein [Amphritea atlantica]SEQ89854.1 SWIM/SEC-C metal-binding motif-containing protein, PBPRA1643 family [Amphritea atlantica]